MIAREQRARAHVRVNVRHAMLHMTSSNLCVAHGLAAACETLLPHLCVRVHAPAEMQSAVVRTNKCAMDSYWSSACSAQHNRPLWQLQQANSAACMFAVSDCSQCLQLKLCCVPLHASLRRS